MFFPNADFCIIALIGASIGSVTWYKSLINWFSRDMGNQDIITLANMEY
jgi:hypothetical protein